VENEIDTTIDGHPTLEGITVDLFENSCAEYLTALPDTTLIECANGFKGLAIMFYSVSDGLEKTERKRLAYKLEAILHQKTEHETAIIVSDKLRG
jgi:hypothetical protein